MKQHFCYYCGHEIVMSVILVTFYTKKCGQCDTSYHFDFSDEITLIVLEATIQDKDYVITHDPSRKKTKVSQRRKELVWRGNNTKILPIKIVEFDGDHKTINPSNLQERLKTILTFL